MALGAPLRNKDYMHENIILSCGVGYWYPNGVNRLKNIVAQYKGIDFKGWTEDFPPGSPSHKEVPYAFKTWALNWAKESGYKKALWLDSSIYPGKDPNQIFDIINTRGYFLSMNGWNQANWSTNEQLKYYGVTRDEAENMSHPVGGIVGINFEHKTGIQLFEHYLQAAIDKMFIGPWTNNNKEVSKDQRVLGSRHDQTCLGFISNKLNLELFVGNYLSYQADAEGFYFYAIPAL